MRNFINTNKNVFGGQLKFGIIAQELAKIYPHMVNHDNDNKLSIEYQQLVAFIPMLFAKIKALEDRIDNL